MAMKVKATFSFILYRPNDLKQPLQLATTDGDLSTATVFTGTVDMTADQLYLIQKAEKEEGKLPVFLMQIKE